MGRRKHQKASRTTAPGHRPVANPELAQAMADRRRSNASGPHPDRRSRRTRTRASARRAALRDQM